MAVALPREGRYRLGTARHDWNEAHRRLMAEPGEWVLPIDGEVSNGTVSWLRARGPLVLAEIRENVEYRIRATHPAEGSSTTLGTLYARYTPGEPVAPYIRGPLTPEQVIAAREEYATGDITQQALADKFGTSASTMNALVRGLSYRHVGGPIVESES
jgi:hypothetical protein